MENFLITQNKQQTDNEIYRILFLKTIKIVDNFLHFYFAN